MEIEDVTPLGSPEEQSSDDESDSSPMPQETAKRRIAHKEMKNISPTQEDETEEKENEQLVTEIEELVQDQMGQKDSYETSDDLRIEKSTESFKENAEENTKSKQASSHSPNFEDISDEENNEAFSPTEDDNQNDANLDSASDNNTDTEKDNVIGTENDLDNINDNEEQDQSHLQDDDEEDYIDAPVPSPFSDIGDISGPEHAIISDILKETSDGNHISPELEGFATELDKPDDPVTLPVSPSEEPEQINSVAVDDKKQADPQKGGGDVGGLIADIFGESDEEEEFEGFGEEELSREKAKSKSRPVISDDDGDVEEKPEQELEAEEKEAINNDIGRVPSPKDEDSSDEEQFKETMVSDFDLMMQRKKEAMRQRRRTKRDFDIINDNDDIIAAMIRKMKDAAEEDRMLNQAGRAATKKMKLLDSVVTHLNKSDLQHTFIDCGILPVMKDWLSPLPDHSLPHLMIRKEFLKILSAFPPLDKGALKMSGIGRAVMLLFKHPKETRQNRNLAGKIVSQWARPIFGVQTNFKDMTREEREERDRMNVPSFKKRRLSSVDESQDGNSSINNALQDEKRPRRPGDKGFIGRARVPRPSNRDYIVRPESNVAYADIAAMGHKNTKKSLSRFEKQMRKYKERKASLGNPSSRAVSISINGSKLAL